jgi:hypothetical protein
MGVVKTASKGYPKVQQNTVELGEHGDLLRINIQGQRWPFKKDYICNWSDCERQSFIITTSSLQEGQLHVCQVNDLTTPPEMVKLTIPQPAASVTYITQLAVRLTSIIAIGRQQCG